MDTNPCRKLLILLSQNEVDFPWEQFSIVFPTLRILRRREILITHGTKACILWIIEPYLSNLVFNLSIRWSKNGRHICGALRDLVPYTQFKKREKHPWKSVNFSKVAG